MSGAISRCDIAWPTWVADALGVREQFTYPDFTDRGGIPINLELILRELSSRYGTSIDWWEAFPAASVIRSLLDDVEDYWERGRGAAPASQRTLFHNLSVWGFQVGDAWQVTDAYAATQIKSPRDDFVGQIPEDAFYRTSRRVLNPDFGPLAAAKNALDLTAELAAQGGVENLALFLGANNVLRTVTELSVRESTDADVDAQPAQRKCNLYLAPHFRRLYERLAASVDRIAGIDRVFVATVPHVTIPPVTRGVSPGGTMDEGYFEFYTRPWVWDDEFDPNRHPKLTRESIRGIDRTIDQYNAIIRETAAARPNWTVVDVSRMLDQVAFRRNAGQPQFTWPIGLVRALKKNDRLKYLVEGRDRVLLDTRYCRVDASNGEQLEKGGLFSLDGVHPTTIGYGLVAEQFLTAMKGAGVSVPRELNWDGIVAADTLVNRPPALLASLRDTLGWFDRRGLLSKVFEAFSS